MQLACPHCDVQVAIEQNRAAEGTRDFGGYVLECDACRHVFHVRRGRDVNDSRVLEGATILATYDDAVAGDKDEVLARFGLQALDDGVLTAAELQDARSLVSQDREPTSSLFGTTARQRLLKKRTRD